MNARPDARDFAAPQKFGIGQPVPRAEDPVLVRGEGRYTDDLALDGQAYAAFVRSPVAHGRLNGIDAEAARAMPGVLGVFTAADLDGYGRIANGMPFTNQDGSPMHKPPQPSLATDKVRYAGEPVAVVVAESLVQARDAAEAVVLDIEDLPVVTTPEEAAAPDAPLLHDDVPGNRALDFQIGDRAACEAAFARAAHVTSLPLVNNRLVINPMEPRSAIGVYEPEAERYTLHVGSQGVFGLRNGLADGVLKVARDKVRVLTGNVGGSFGMKAPVYPEYLPLLHAAKVLGRPVKWTDLRSESFLSDHHGRDVTVTAELALDAQGRFLAFRVCGHANMGAYLNPLSPLFQTVNIARNMVGVYRTPVFDVAVECLYTNTTPIGAYRGAGRPEGNYFIERLIDAAAAETGRDRVALRRLNHIRPEDMPYAAPSGLTYDSGDFPAVLDRALAAADWDGFEARRTESAARGKLRGIGIGDYLEITAPPTNEMGGIRFEADGTVTIITGTLDYGQGHATPFAQVLHDRLGIPLDRVRLLQGDSDQLIAGGGTGGSKSLMASGAAIVEASAQVIEKGRAAASAVLEAGPADIAFENGRFVIAGTDRGIGLLDLAARVRAGLADPEAPTSLDVAHIHAASPSAFPNGCHIAEVEVDPETGVAAVVRYTTVNDFGTVVNPLLVEGQIHGGVVQGIGQALLERTAYDEQGQLVTGSFMDYCLPRAADAPLMSFESHPVPAKTNPLGAKGCGEAGCAGALPSVMNALVDALRPRGVTHINMPATPRAIWTALREAESA
ncbi:xanthine dehydrogenase family protein molybdopterin-binding subunit [Methylobacterium nodulans]|uniref:Aldehyde oxidase and xanthine dehydrogenase molybdopterin binding n=1 Tax=Methylobacterium nodulans (strain LMG 21967 / CNCM I-2342 / ORS 2060) TaxID=460265 RepID=B8ILF0_METNO|nr:xanthine dehydrogenase family protein molybdopterin-binding subunit [Methylobacterium nodulans]ACL60149.1 aldehyde oxidase and xanthine dehydrogenase molybdopterin binding [Methylobacterium nodulans ORS 2060]